MQIRRVCRILAVIVCICRLGSIIFAEDFPVLVRAENIIVPPSTGPVTHIIVKNPQIVPYNCRIRAKYSDGWTISPAEFDVSLTPGQEGKFPISIDKAINLKSNTYPVEITVISGEEQKVIKQNIFVATSPVFTPKIDGNLKDWSAAVPITFETKDRKTVISTGWSKKYFNVAVEVEEDELLGYKAKSDKAIDAVQFAIAPRNSHTPTAAGQLAQRYEFLIVNSPGFMSSDKCFQLMQPGDKIEIAAEDRDLAPLQVNDAKVVVKRKKNFTVYECSIPLSLMPKIKAMTGRDYLMSFLIHDPDGTGIRDFGQVSGLWEFQRNKFAWSTWKGIKWDNKPQFDSKLEWAFCTSKY